MLKKLRQERIKLNKFKIRIKKRTAIKSGPFFVLKI